MTENEILYLEILRANPLKDISGSPLQSEQLMWKALDAARAENDRILAMLRDPPEDVVEAMAKAGFAAFNGLGFWENYRSIIRAAISALAGKIADGQPSPPPDQIPIVNRKPED